MAGRIEPLTETGIIADLLKSQRRNAQASAAVQMPQPAKDLLTVTANGQPATWQLSAVPLGSSVDISLNGWELDEGVDYTVNYTTGIVSFSSAQQALLRATPTPADVLTADYWTTGDLIALSEPIDTGAAAFIDAASATSAAVVTSVSVTVPATAQVGHLLVLAGSMRGTQDFTTPTGWTLAASNTTDGVSRLTAWYRICQSGDAGSTVTLTIAAGGTETPSAACLVYSGINTTTPLFTSLMRHDTSASTTWGGGSLDCTAATGQSLVVLIWGSHPAGSLPVTFDAAVTGRLSVGGGLSHGNMIAVADEVIAAGAIEPSRNLTVQAPGEPYVEIALAFTEA